MEKKTANRSENSSLSEHNLAFLAKIRSDYPAFTIKPGKKFLFRPKRTIYYREDDNFFPLLLLHELSHALLGHFSYETSLERIKIERDAWEKTKSLCGFYGVPFEESFSEEELNSYRDWLHKKTLCKLCGLTCIELSSTSLYCPKCQKVHKR